MLTLEITSIVVVLGSARLLLTATIIAIILFIILIVSSVGHFGPRSHLVLVARVGEVSVVPLDDVLRSTVAVLSSSLELILANGNLLLLAVVIGIWNSLSILIILHLIDIAVGQRSRVKCYYILL